MVSALKAAYERYLNLIKLPDHTFHINTLFGSSGGFAHKSPLTGEPIFGQHGFHGSVTGPTLFLAGEAGRERVDISPNGQGGVAI